jgi:arabinogalactan oligomer/maltooligosaccharide transport system permease protein
MKTGSEEWRDAAVLQGLPGEWDPELRRRAFLSLCLLPALLALSLVLVYPLFYNVYLSLSDAGVSHLRGSQLSGFHQYAAVFGETEFWATFGRTVVWTLVCSTLQIALGVFLAVILNQNFIRGRAAWRLLLLLPWAIPQYITALTWRGMFNGEHGAVNSLLSAVGAGPVDWLTTPFAAFVAMMLVNVWMGFPFIMVIALTGLRAIPDSVYEAAQLEGASAWMQFTRLTAPLLRPVMLPATALAIVWNFNNLNLVWLFSSGGQPDGKTHILVSYVYQNAFSYYRFGLAAALSVVIFVILFLFVQAFLQVSRWRR